MTQLVYVESSIQHILTLVHVDAFGNVVGHGKRITTAEPIDLRNAAEYFEVFQRSIDEQNRQLKVDEDSQAAHQAVLDNLAAEEDAKLQAKAAELKKPGRVTRKKTAAEKAAEPAKPVARPIPIRRGKAKTGEDAVSDPSADSATSEG